VTAEPCRYARTERAWRSERGREDVAAGRIVSQDEVEQRLAKWLDE
jgi:predicted transcriptional regulator